MIAVLALLLATGFSIAGTPFEQADILDARGEPDVGGKAIVRITLTPEAAERLRALTAKNAGMAVTIAVDDEIVAEPVIVEPIASGELAIASDMTLEQADALALRIAGKPPLPDEFEE